MLYVRVNGAAALWDMFVRADRHHGWTYDGITALYEYLSDLEMDIEADIIALDSEFSEYESVADAIEEYGDDFDEGEIAATAENGLAIIVRQH